MVSTIAQWLSNIEYKNIDISEFSFEGFDYQKDMFDYQVEALENTLKFLIRFYRDYDGDKNRFYENEYRANYEHKNIFLKQNKLLGEFYENSGKKIPLSNFINRLCFWMTTGSGKTIVIIKLIELLDNAMQEGLIKKRDILFFTANDNLLSHFLDHVRSYNTLSKKRIEVFNLKKYKQFKETSLNTSIKICAYRADLLSDEGKENILDFRPYFNNGENYVILDEAHKGNKQESKRQNIFSILSKEGFLFNFSATFVEDIDIITTIYNLNQIKWVEKGYGKKIFLLDSDLRAFKIKEELNTKDKQKAVLKALILLTLTKLNKLQEGYHDPMMVVFTNSVNTKMADAEIFFKILNSIIKNENINEIFLEAKDELRESLKNDYLIKGPMDSPLSEGNIDLNELSLDTLKEEIFYAKSGNIEAISNPNNANEICFKLDSVDKVFCLIKIGDITPWLKEKLKDIKIDKSIKDESYFQNINKSSINILIGSRSFYEGWDSNRPNVMLFLNIGVEKDSKKFITQSIGRGMRIQSINDSRKRLRYITFNNKHKIEKEALILETLFIISTNRAAIESILENQKEQNAVDENYIEVELEKTPNSRNLLIPVYKNTKNKISKENKFLINKKDNQELMFFLKAMGKELFALKYNFFNKEECDLLFEVLENNRDFVSIDENITYVGLDSIIRHLMRTIYVNQTKVEKFKNLENEIIHFKKIRVKEEKLANFLNAKNEVMQEGVLEELKENYKQKEVRGSSFIKLSNHYYNPLITSRDSNWMKNIIKEESEIQFLKKLLKIKPLIDGKYEWWMFSKISEIYDSIYIPYNQYRVGKNFYPDFIFWLSNKDSQKILLVDPKGVSHTSYELKVDGYEKIFKNKNELKIFNTNGVKVTLELKLIANENSDIEKIGKEYRKYWIARDEIENMF